jgi:hypothetical protein
MKITAIVFRERLLLFLLLACVAATLLSALSSNRIAPNLAEFFNHIGAIVQAKMALAEGQFPLRVAPFEHSGWRYPLFQFTSPTSYTFAALLYQWLTPDNPFAAYKLTIWCALVAGGIYLYRLACCLFDSKPASLLASVVYMTTPYYIIVINHIGGFNEAIALGIVPVVMFYTLQRYLNPSNNKTLLQMSLAWYMLATVHIITFAYTSLFAGLLFIFATLKNPTAFLRLLETGLAYVFGALLALWYLAPLFMLRKFLNYANLAVNPEIFTSYKPTLSNLLSPALNINNPVKTGSGMIEGLAVIHPSFGIPLLFAALVSIYALLSHAKLRNARANEWLAPLFCVFAIAIVMVWSPFNFWQWLPKSFMIGLYSWRMLAQVGWIGALLFAWSMLWLFENKLGARHVVLGLFLIILATSSWIPITERNYVALNIPQLIKNPEQQNGDNLYLLDVQRELMNIHNLDKVSLDLFDDNHPLAFNTNYALPKIVFALAAKPSVILDGLMPAHDGPAQPIRVFVDGLAVAAFTTEPGVFHWEIPLTEVLKKHNKNFTLSLQFKTDTLKDKFTAKVTGIAASGFFAANEILSVKQTQPDCHQEKDVTVCHINAARNIKLIELPVIFYPEMLRVTLNKKLVTISNVLYENTVLAAVTPVVGENVITVQFTGLMWANTLSYAAWGLWLIFLIYVMLDVGFNKRRVD